MIENTIPEMKPIDEYFWRRKMKNEKKKLPLDLCAKMATISEFKEK